MIYSIIPIAILLLIILYPLWMLGLYKIFAKNKSTQTHKELKVYLCDGFLFFGQGIFLGFLHSAIVKQIYYTEKGSPYE